MEREKGRREGKLEKRQNAAKKRGKIIKNKKEGNGEQKRPACGVLWIKMGIQLLVLGALYVIKRI